MQFQVPQFIEVEDKIFGPLTFRQFIYLGGGVGTGYIMYRVLPFFIAVPIALGCIGFAAALAFYKYNGRPFILAVESAFFYMTRTKLYLWNNSRKAQNALENKRVSAQSAETYAPKLSESKLHDLAWNLDIQERIASGTISDEERMQRNQVLPIRTLKSELA